MKYAFIIHGFNGDTIYTFGPLLKKELERKNYTVIIPEFPIRSEATYLGWSSILKNYIQYFNEDTIVVCHSIGNPFVIKFLAENNLKIQLYVSVSGFCELFSTGRDDLDTAFHDFKVLPKEIEYCKLNIQYIYSLYSNNDHVIPFEILKSFIQHLNSKDKFIPNVGHMGNRQTINEWQKVTNVICNIFQELKI